MRHGRPPADDKLAAVHDLARQIVVDRGRVDDGAIARVLQAGCSWSEILEIVAECTFAGLVGVVDNLVGRVELDEFLTPRAWG